MSAETSSDASGIWRETSDASGRVHAPMEAVAWRVRGPRGGWMHSDKLPSSWRNAEPLYTHPAPIKPSADTGELRERVAASIGSAWAHGTHGKPFDVKAETDAILDLIQSERGK